MRLYLDTVSDLLLEILKKLMTIEAFNSFRIVGGTSLSLQLGHRESVDIDLFTDLEYGSLDFEELEKILIDTFPIVESNYFGPVGFGKPFFIGNSKNDLIKLDLYYTDQFVFPCLVKQNIRFSSIEEVAAMKFEVITRGGRKKDFWDVHELLETYSLDELISFYLKRNPYGSSKEEVLKQMVDFSVAEHDFTPNCLKNKDWEIIKLDIVELVKG
ncbi:MAG: nucleotidyl transferase AbiEii/AbiGii toxin family protein [Bacteroidetes bacterium]|nr:MAG: nucleotidyl transferase AbiEii/AbiGii toxin family protein [Bacteroidota bacterium]MBL1145096.1 nucleotidyl transferase AbiEii/AbiGii toxin family protein [Bacteroidota bacterium]NOG57893.1 nucleotidyl transferase AbiEii/AbiGii toxin family protein [Bacteroidota bacterium]